MGHGPLEREIALMHAKLDFLMKIIIIVIFPSQYDHRQLEL
jgi:hypothetical protein